MWVKVGGVTAVDGDGRGDVSGGGSGDGGMAGVMELVNFFCEMLANKYFRLCKPNGL